MPKPTGHIRLSDSAICSVDSATKTRECVGLILSYEVLQLGPRAFNWVEVGAVRGQKLDGRATTFNQLLDPPTLVCVEIVPAHDVSRLKNRQQTRLHETLELTRPHTASNSHLSDETVETQGANDHTCCLRA